MIKGTRKHGRRRKYSSLPQTTGNRAQRREKGSAATTRSYIEGGNACASGWGLGRQSRPPTVKMARFSVCCVVHHWSFVALGGKKTKIAFRRCTSSPSPETFSEKFGASPCSSKDKKKRKSGFSSWELQVRMILLGICTARYGPVSDL